MTVTEFNNFMLQVSVATGSGTCTCTSPVCSFCTHTPSVQGTMASHGSVHIMPVVKAEPADLAVPQSHSWCSSEETHDPMQMLKVKTEVDIPEEPLQPLSHCHSNGFSDPTEMLKVKTEVNDNVPEEPPQSHSPCDCEYDTSNIHEPMETPVKTEVSAPEERLLALSNSLFNMRKVNDRLDSKVRAEVDVPSPASEEMLGSVSSMAADHIQSKCCVKS